ncbi:MAG: LTA synthase family protein [Planctomycetota bacterium]|nr:LTA synthase family protein [Planctomycetota bacterium]
MDSPLSPQGRLARLFQSRFGSLYVLGLTMLCVWTILRAALMVRSGAAAGPGVVTIGGGLLIGLAFDLAACFVLLLPTALLLALLPDRWVNRRGFARLGLIACGVALYVTFFEAAVEWFFWSEFTSRFNLVAVEYLKDSDEVLGNMWATYPVVWVSLALLAPVAGVLWLGGGAIRRSYRASSTAGGRLKGGAVFLAGALLALPAFGMGAARVYANDFANALAQNGPICFTRAFISRTPVYRECYPSREDSQVLAGLRLQLAEPNSRYTNESVPGDITRAIDNGSGEPKHNIVVICVESLSAKFLGKFGNTEKLTPYLDALADKGLLLTNLYATGTRTIRGLEAITISLPPTPGLAVVKRAGAGKLFSVEHMLKRHGYAAKFLYGGRASFDSMDSFLGQDAFEMIDKDRFAKDEITFQTPWGVCDEDLFSRLSKECSASHAAGKPFFAMAMTVSNHQPFTFPANKIDMAPGTLDSTVKYTDYAIGQFLEKAKTQPWFKNTVFLIVADHCARHEAEWKAFKEVSPARYHIPAIIYAPGLPELVKPGVNNTLCSQIDLMPTILGMLKMSYTTKLFGRDIIASPPHRAFISNPGDLGLLVDGKLVILEPRRTASTYVVNPDDTEDLAKEMDPALLEKAINYYQGAAYVLDHHLYQNE